MLAQHAQDALQACQIDVYLRPLDILTYNVGTNFTLEEFRQYTTSMLITTKEVLVEAHQLVGIVEQYYAPFQRAYIITRKELKDKGINKDVML